MSKLKHGGYDYTIQNDYHYINIGATTVDQLKKAGVFPNKNYSGLTQNKPDGLILQGKDSVKVLIEYKKGGVFSSKEEAPKILTEWYFTLAQILDCPVICASDGTNTYWFSSKTKELIKDENGNELRFIFDSAKIADKN